VIKSHVVNVMIFVEGIFRKRLRSILFYFYIKKEEFFVKRKITGFLCLLLVFVYMSSIVTVQAASSENTSITFNNASKSVTVSGYDSKLGTLYYQFSDTLTFTFKNTGLGNWFNRASYNRYSFNYSTESYIKGEIYYRASWREYTEVFYLEPGTNVSFASFMDNFLDGDSFSTVSKMVFTPLYTESNVTTLSLSSINTTYYNLPSEQTVYLENDQYKIGVALFYGGGINYIEDKADNDAELGNLLNHCDAGRLVQQSYYGTMEEPYVCATYSGNTWSYNPVQGGDQYNNKSKLIDFEMTDTYIYVKCRPLDWAQNNLPTLSYMENSYTIEDGFIRVDNRFIDFSGYNHPTTSHQELPAFYTISYLDTFTFYDGTSPWKNDTLTVKENLEFWGGNPDAYFNVQSGNTETWCSWTSSETGYGIGLYTPGAEILLAGRHSYNGSKDPANGATNYVAPLRTFGIPNYKPFEYSYLITTGSTDEIRTTFAQQSNFAEEGIKDTHKLAADATDGIVSISGHTDDTYISTSFAEGQSYEITFTPKTGYVLGSVSRSDGVAVSYTANSTSPLTITGEMPSYDLSYNVIFNPIIGDDSTLTQHSYDTFSSISGFAADSDVSAQLATLNTELTGQGYSEVTLYHADGTVATGTDTFTTDMYFTLNGSTYYTAILGDTTSDGTVNIADAVAAYKHLLGTSKLTYGAITAADASGDEKTNIIDVMSILNAI